LLGPGFEVGRIASVCAVNTSIAAAAGGVAGLLANLYIEERRTGEIHFDLTAAMNGVLSGLVAITAGCATVDMWAAALIGTIAGLLYLASSAFLVRIKIDDVVEAIPVHCFNGAWGLIATGLFSTPQSLKEIYGIEDHVGWVYSWGRGSIDATLLFSQIMALIFVSSWVILTMGPFFYMLRHLKWFRIEKVDELLGLDQMLHGGTPDEDGSQNASTKPVGFIRGLLGNSEHSSSHHQHGL
jgi:Amt family ammonium transporter